MNEYDGFATVQDPQEYMNAPAMIIPPDGEDDHRRSAPPPILRAAIDATRGYELLSADEIQAHYAEQNVLQQRISDVVSRLDVEVKMREAARSLSRLHRKPSDASMSPSLATSTSGSARKRISKIFSGGGSGDSKEKRQSAVGLPQQRHSMQADEEAEISGEKIRHLEQLRFDLSQRKSLVDRRIVQHHAAVMARALGGVPIPNHRRLQSGASGLSNYSGSSTPGQRQSWVFADTQGMQGSGKHMRSISGVSGHSIESSLATVREHPQNATARPGSASASKAGSPAMANPRLEEEVNMLAARIAQALPGMSPAPQGAMAFMSNAFERLLRELSDTRNSAEAYHIQAQHSEERIEFLNRELERAGSQSRSVSGAASEGNSAGRDAELAQLRHEIDAERTTLQQLRTQSSQQRAELERTTRSLEDVTRLAVQYESERVELEQLLSSLETRNGALEKDKTVLLQQRLGATQNSSLLCKEFQRIVGELVEQHQQELRQLHPRLTPSSTVAALQKQQNQQKEQEPSQAQLPPKDSTTNGSTSPTNPGHTATTTHSDNLHQSNHTSEGSRGYSPHTSTQQGSALNPEFSQSPEPLSVHSAIRKPVMGNPQASESSTVRRKLVPDSSNSAYEHSEARAPSPPTEVPERAPGHDRSSIPRELQTKEPADNDYKSLPPPIDSDMSQPDHYADEEDLGAPRLQRLDSDYSADFSEYSRSSSVYPETNSAAQSQASVLPQPHNFNMSQASIARAQDYSFNSNDELL